MLIFLLNNTLHTIREKENNVYNREITVYPSQMTADDWQYIEQHPDFEFYKVAKSVNKTLNEYRIGDIVAFKNNQSFVKNVKQLPINFSQDILVESVIYDELMKKDNKLNEPIELGGYKYNIIGTSQNNLEQYISYETFKQQYVPSKIVIYLNKNALNKYNELSEALSQRFLSTVDSFLEQMEKWYISGALSIIIIGCSLIVLNEIFLYVFLIKKRQKEFNIYNILGLTRNQRIVYYNFELLIFSSVTFLLNTIIWSSVMPYVNGLLPLLPYIFSINIILNIFVLNSILLFTFRRKAL